MERKICVFDGCNNLEQRCGYCRKHYDIMLHGESHEPKKICSVNGCNNTVFRKDYCYKHYRQTANGGTIHITEHEQKTKARQKQTELILADLRSGMSRNDACDKYALSMEQIKYIIQQSGDKSLMVVHAMTVEKLQKLIADNRTKLQYAGGYEAHKGLYMYCSDCGGTYYYACKALYSAYPIKCKRCAKEKAARQREAAAKEKEKTLEMERARREAEREIIRETRRREVVCDVCGKTFTTYNERTKRCSPECSKKHRNRISTQRHDKRISKEKRIDDIDLRQLYNRDSGVCHICGKQCDWNDYAITDVAFIAGNNYPSVDHVIPIAKGGENSWSNVKLAHRICNSRKSDKVDVPAPGVL